MCSGLLRLRGTGCHLPHPQKMVHGRKTNKVRCLLVKISHCQAKRKLTMLESDSDLEESNCISVRSLEREWSPPLWVLFIDFLTCIDIPKGFQYQTDAKMVTLFTMPKSFLGFGFSLLLVSYPTLNAKHEMPPFMLR